MNEQVQKPEAVVDFWRAAGPARWFEKDEAFDHEFRDRFLDAHMAAAARRLDAWAETAGGTLALLVLLDQFPRNAFRGTAHMFATDPLARHFTRRLLDRGGDAEVEQALRTFCYLPLMHSEELRDQQDCVALYRGLGDANSLHYAELHLDAIEHFGRFPHRNPVLGRETTADEQAFLDGGGFAG